MKKKELIEIITPLSDYQLDDTGKALVNGIKRSLSAFPDDTELEEFCSVKNFGGYRRPLGDDNINEELKLIDCEVQTWVGNNRVGAKKSESGSKKKSAAWRMLWIVGEVLEFIAGGAGIFIDMIGVETLGIDATVKNTLTLVFCGICALLLVIGKTIDIIQEAGDPDGGGSRYKGQGVVEIGISIVTVVIVFLSVYISLNEKQYVIGLIALTVVLAMLIVELTFARHLGGTKNVQNIKGSNVGVANVGDRNQNGNGEGNNYF